MTVKVIAFLKDNKRRWLGYLSWGNCLLYFMLSNCVGDFSFDSPLNYINFWPQASPDCQGSEEGLASGTWPNS